MNSHAKTHELEQTFSEKPCVELGQDVYDDSIKAGFTEADARKQAELARKDCHTLGLDKKDNKVKQN